MSHHRVVCQHDVVITQCRCIKTSVHATKVVRPCPFGTQHLGYVVVHPEQPTAEGQEPGQLPDLPAVRAMKLCVFRSCTWEVPEPEDMLGWPGVEARIREHLGAEHRDAIELMSAALR